MAREKISQREYAKRLGVSHTAVQRAIREGRIHKGYSVKDQKIYPDIANTEWGDMARVQIGSINAVGNNSGVADAGASSKKIGMHSDPVTIRKQKELLQAQMLSLDLKQRIGELVEREKVEKELTAYGQQIRRAFEQIAVRNIDAIRSANTRNEAIEVLDEAVRDVLTRLTTIVENGLKKNVNG